MKQQVLDAFTENPVFLITFFAEKLGYIGVMYLLCWLAIRPKASQRHAYRFTHHLFSLFAAPALFTVCVLEFSVPADSHRHTIYALIFAVVAAFSVRFKGSVFSTNEESSTKAKLVGDERVESSRLRQTSHTSAHADFPASLNNKFFQDAMTEFSSDRRITGLWARCFAETDGDENKAQARYIKYRVAEMAHIEDGIKQVEKSFAASLEESIKAATTKSKAHAENSELIKESFLSSMSAGSRIAFGVFLLAVIFVFMYAVTQTRETDLTTTQTSEPTAAILPSTSSAAIQLKVIDDESLARFLGKPVLNLTKAFANGTRDLDGDGVDEVFIADTSTDCGNGGCTYLLVVSNNGQQKNVGEVQAKVIESLLHTSNGMKDLKVTWNSGCQSVAVSTLKFDGYRYKVANSYERAGACGSDSSSQQLKSAEQVAAPVPRASSNARQLNREGIVQIRNGQFRQAALSLAEASSLAPQDPEILGNWGYALFMGGDAIRAEEALRKALVIKPNRGSTLNNLGLVLAAQGHQLEATDFFVRYFEASTNKATALDQLTAWSTSTDSSIALRNAADGAIKATLQRAK